MKSHKDILKAKLQKKSFKEKYTAEKKLIDLAVAIQKKRIEKGLSQREIAEKARLTQQQVSAIENGSNFTVKTLFQIADVLNMKLKY
jgi:DNA-binding XRE family transcriptional regulator